MAIDQVTPLPLVQLLLERGADATLPGRHGNNDVLARALGYTRWGANKLQGVAVVQLLLRAVSDPDRADDFGETLLRKAAGRIPDWPEDDIIDEGFRPEEIVAYVEDLLAVGASVDKTNPQGETALFAATRAGNPLVVQVLLNAGADRHHRNVAGQTAYEVTRDEIVPDDWVPQVFAHRDELLRLLQTD